MAKAVLTTKVDPSYDDLPEDRYHFPHRYLNRRAGGTRRLDRLLRASPCQRRVNAGSLPALLAFDEPEDGEARMSCKQSGGCCMWRWTARSIVGLFILAERSGTCYSGNEM